jgi:NADPH:quinone reductase-like Zn-dependent oxidoreductase
MSAETTPTCTSITYSKFGDPGVLTVTHGATPEPGPGHVRVRVHAASVNPWDVKVRRGDFASVIPTHFPATPGLDAAGTVDAIGAGVEDVAIGAEVLGLAAPGGAYAQYAIMKHTVPKPPSVSWEIAASIPVIGEAAFRALRHLDLKAGEILLIHGAAGSVGAIATQLAVSRGVTVIGSVGADDEEYVRALGAQPVQYGDALAAEVRAISPRGVDAVLDAAGHDVLPVSIELAGSPKRVVTLADPNAAKYDVYFSGNDPKGRAPEAVAEIAQLAAAGKMTIKIWRTYPLAEAAAAHADVEAGRTRGKIVLLP